VVVVPSATLLHRCYIAATVTPTTTLCLLLWTAPPPTTRWQLNSPATTRYSPPQRDTDDDHTTINRATYHSPNHCWLLLWPHDGTVVRRCDGHYPALNVHRRVVSCCPRQFAA
jgi:hypothetical protein